MKFVVFILFFATSSMMLPGTECLKYIGAASGRSFFAEPYQEVVGRNRDTAKAYCTSAGMDLAVITTPDQVTFLNSVTDVTIRTGSEFWIDAIESLNASRFVWDTSGQVPSGTLLNWDTTELAPNRGCAMLILPVNKDPAYIHAHSCNLATGVLCYL